ncbi:hypothetical protein B7492_32660 (plasmid) [Bacillus mycoides]|uniref:Uncharacterized protein n=1 Tax=Bacillus mycoides TaxID=1405 RepID=A0A1W6AIZ0_BACMY|nr:hypothetical protein [Bacillus mycoides]ARJ25789.1 hypothetical protein B7492_32660 [Bacillus mycoides]
MEKIEIANELLKNSTGCIKEFIEEYLLNFKELEQEKYENEDDESLVRLHNCISYIKEEDFDITGWELWEIPIFYSHCFFNKQNDEQFDLAVWDLGEVIPRYINDHSNEQDAKNIEEAIKKYS